MQYLEYSKNSETEGQKEEPDGICSIRYIFFTLKLTELLLCNARGWEKRKEEGSQTALKIMPDIAYPLSHLILPITLQNHHHSPHSTDEKTEPKKLKQYS